MSRCDSEGATHHTGCECHEARRDAEIESLKAEVERLRAVVRLVHALAVTEEKDYRCVRVVENLREIHKLTKENP